MFNFVFEHTQLYSNYNGRNVGYISFWYLTAFGARKAKTLCNAIISPGTVMKSPRGYLWANTLTVCFGEHIGPGIMAISQLGAEI